MGAWFSSLLFSWFGGGLQFPNPDFTNMALNPIFAKIEAHRSAESALKEAEKAAQAAKDLSEEIKRGAEEECKRAHEREEEANRATARAAEEMEKMKAQIVEAANAAKRGEELAAAATQAAQEDAAKYAREVQEGRERAQKMREDAERAMSTAKEEAERARQAADEQRHRAEAGKALAEEMARTAVEEARKANEAKADAERRLKEGIRPVMMPSLEEVAVAKERIQYREDCFHFAVAGISGSGKSSLVNAFRALENNDSGAAAVGVTETTLEMSRYEDANPSRPFVWYDIPGAGTFKCPEWQYFNDQCLYIFDCIIVLFDTRFTTTDIAILTCARRFNIPTYIVRSKADQHIRNAMADIGYKSDEDEDEDIQVRRQGSRNEFYKTAREMFIEKTRKSVKENLENANIPDQRVYIVSSDQLCRIARSKMPRKGIDEVILISDLASEAYMRQKVKHAPSEDASSMGSRVSSLVLAGLTQSLTASVGLIDGIRPT